MPDQIFENLNRKKLQDDWRPNILRKNDHDTRSAYGEKQSDLYVIAGSAGWMRNDFYILRVSKCRYFSQRWLMCMHLCN